MKYPLVMAAALAFSIISCKEKNEYEELNKMDWLIGTWNNNMPEKTYTEVWKKANDSTFTGYSYVIRDKDTTPSETLNLSQRNGNLYYIANVNNQNNGESVYFTLTGSDDDKYVFENPEHDFPTKIVYNKINNDSLFAEISGKLGGKSRTVGFPMKRQE